MHGRKNFKLSSTCFEYPSVYSLLFLIIIIIYIYIINSELKKYHKTACKSLPEDEHLDVRNMSKTL